MVIGHSMNILIADRFRCYAGRVWSSGEFLVIESSQVALDFCMGNLMYLQVNDRVIRFVSLSYAGFGIFC